MKQPTTININEWIKSVFKETLDEYLRLEKLYDEETDHRLNFEKQQEWEDCLIKTMQQYKSMFEKAKLKETKTQKFPKIKNNNSK